MNKPDQAEIIRQVAAVAAREPLSLPPSWWDSDVAERMAAWIKHNVPADERLTFTYGL